MLRKGLRFRVLSSGFQVGFRVQVVRVQVRGFRVPGFRVPASIGSVVRLFRCSHKIPEQNRNELGTWNVEPPNPEPGTNMEPGTQPGTWNPEPGTASRPQIAQRSSTDPTVNPAPTEVSSTRLPFFSRPSAAASFKRQWDRRRRGVAVMADVDDDLLLRRGQGARLPRG